MRMGGRGFFYFINFPLEICLNDKDLLYLQYFHWKIIPVKESKSKIIFLKEYFQKVCVNSFIK